MPLSGAWTDGRAGKLARGPSWAARLFMLVLLAILAPVYAADAGAGASAGEYPGLLAERAVSMGLHERRAWHVLLHYRPALLGGVESLVDDPAFFLSKTGKTDPASEMRETVMAFFAPGPDGDTHARCRFAARFEWLRGELPIDGPYLPERPCPGLEEFKRSVAPRSAVLVFPVSHMNSPASMFGHTLLRIDSDTESPLYSWAVNYSARTGETSGVLFAFRGIFGYYEGFFGVLPYYEKIKEYSSLENRDIWEYGLELSTDEVERMLLHLWELKDIWAEYYFFDENCSYNLLLVLEAARPGLDLAGALPPWVIPIDTIRAIRGSGVSAGKAVYRPSKAARIRHLREVVPRPLASAALSRASGAGAPALASEAWPAADRARALELAAEYLQYRHARKMVEKDEYSRLLLDILGQRSSLGSFPPREPEPPEAPDAGHGPARLTAGLGVKAGQSFARLSLRPANHSLTDPDAGYLPGAAITFMEAEARYYMDEGKLALHRLSLVEIDSASPRDDFFKPISWAVSAGLAREETKKRAFRTVFAAGGGPGLSYALAGGGLAYGFLGPELKAGSGLDHGYAIGAGLRAGLLRAFAPYWKARLELGVRVFGPGDAHTVTSAEINQTFSLTRDSAIGLDLRRERFDGFLSHEARVGLNLYF